MEQKQTLFSVETKGEGFIDITKHIREFVRKSEIKTGLLTVFMQHTSAGLTIQENADPDVMKDLKDYFNRAVPHNDSLYRHIYEGSDDMPAHIRSTLTETSLNIPIVNNEVALGRWQAVYVCEFRLDPHIRNVILHIMGEK